MESVYVLGRFMVIEFFAAPPTHGGEQATTAVMKKRYKARRKTMIIRVHWRP